MASEEANKYGGEVFLGDRPVEVTLLILRMCSYTVLKSFFGGVMHWYFDFISDLLEQITLKRTWGKMPLWHKVKFLYSIVLQVFFLPKSEDIKKMVKKNKKIKSLLSF